MDERAQEEWLKGEELLALCSRGSRGFMGEGSFTCEGRAGGVGVQASAPDPEGRSQRPWER